MRTKEELDLIREYCEIFRDWARLIHKKAAEFDGSTSNSGMWEAERWQKLAEAMSIVELAIIKSCYLDRRLYGGEAERLIKCPEHQGRWSGCAWGDSMCVEGCMYGSNVTGWLPDLHEFELWERDGEQKKYFPMKTERCYQCGGKQEAVVHNINKYRELEKELI